MGPTYGVSNNGMVARTSATMGSQNPFATNVRYGINGRYVQHPNEIRPGEIPMNGLDVDEAGKVADMIKDLAQAAKYSAEACYYKTITDAMHEEHEEHEESSHTWSVMDHMNGLKEMYKSADPATKKQMKADVAKLLNEMPN